MKSREQVTHTCYVSQAFCQFSRFFKCLWYCHVACFIFCQVTFEKYWQGSWVNWIIPPLIRNLIIGEQSFLKPNSFLLSDTWLWNISKWNFLRWVNIGSLRKTNCTFNLIGIFSLLCFDNLFVILVHIKLAGKKTTKTWLIHNFWLKGHGFSLTVGKIFRWHFRWRVLNMTVVSRHLFNHYNQTFFYQSYIQ